MIPAAAPMMNTITVKKSIRSPLPDTMSAIVPIMYSYLPRMRRMKLPDIPGSIMAHMAMAPQMRMNQSPSGVSVGERVADHHAEDDAEDQHYKVLHFPCLDAFQDEYGRCHYETEEKGPCLDRLVVQQVLHQFGKGKDADEDTGYQ